MATEHGDRAAARICLLVSSALTIGGLLNWWRTGHLLTVMVLTGTCSAMTALLYLRSRAR